VRPGAPPGALHGDAQQNNFLSTPGGAVPIDVAPYYGHPELDLALVDYVASVGAEVFDGYRELAPIDPGFPQRRELWRLAGYLAVITVDGLTSFGPPFLDRIAAAVALYR
jgi:fructosamine-3-kinase